MADAEALISGTLARSRRGTPNQDPNPWSSGTDMSFATRSDGFLVTVEIYRVASTIFIITRRLTRSYH